MKSSASEPSIRRRSHGIERIFDQLKKLTWHFVLTGPFNIFALSTRNFERLYFRTLRVVPCERTNFQPVEKTSGAVWTFPKNRLLNLLTPSLVDCRFKLWCSGAVHEGHHTASGTDNQGKLTIFCLSWFNSFRLVCGNQFVGYLFDFSFSRNLIILLKVVSQRVDV